MDQIERQETRIISDRYETVMIQSTGDGYVLGFGVYDHHQGKIRDFPLMKLIDAKRMIELLDPYGSA